MTTGETRWTHNLPEHGPPQIVVMGVAGAGKTTVGRLLAQRLGLVFLEGDDFHPPANVAKMSLGRPLTDTDRWPWLASIAAELIRLRASGQGAVVACSALRQAYRDELSRNLPGLLFVHLTGPYDLIAARLAERIGHFMPPALLRSQFDTLEPPAGAGSLAIEIGGTPEAMAASIADQITAELERRRSQEG